MLKFERKIRKVAGCYVVTIPKQYIIDHLLNLQDTTIFFVEEKKEVEKNV